MVHLHKRASTGVSHAFETGDLFLVKPGDEHGFVADTQATFLILRYTESARFILKELVMSSGGRAIGLSKAKSPFNMKIRLGESDEFLIINLFELIERLCQALHRNENLIYYQMLCVIMVVERNLTFVKRTSEPVREKESVNRILKHIHKYIRDPEMLRLSYVASRFHMSANTLSSYFKRETGLPVKQYVDQCRMELIRERVVKTELAFSEIAHEFGFVDESHFYKFFRRFQGQSPTQSRNASTAELVVRPLRVKTAP